MTRHRVLAGGLALVFALTWACPSWAMRQESLREDAVGLESLTGALRGPTTAAPNVGLESPDGSIWSQLFRGFDQFSPEERRRMVGEASGLLSQDRLWAYHQQIASPGTEILQVFPPAAYGGVDIVEVTDAAIRRTPDIERVGRQQIARAAFLLQAGGGGTRFDGSLSDGYRARITRETDLPVSKPTARLGASRKSIIIRTLEALARTALNAGVSGVPVFINVTSDTKAQICSEIKQWSPRLNLGSLRIYLTDQDEYPTFDQEGHIITTVHPETGRLLLHTSGVGTLGGVIAMGGGREKPALDQEGNPVDQSPLQIMGDRTHLVILYGDDPVLTNPTTISRLLGAAVSSGADLLPVGIARRDLNGYPSAGKIVSIHKKPLIAEKADRKKGRPHEHLDAVERDRVAVGRRPFPANTGLLILSRQALAETLRLYREGAFPTHPTEPKATKLYQRASDARITEIVVGAKKIELFLTDVVDVVGRQEGAEGGPQYLTTVAEVDGPLYSAAKELGTLIQAEAKLFQAGRRAVETAGGSVAAEARIEVAPLFQGPLSRGVQVQGPIAVSIEADRVIVRPLTETTDRIRLEATVEEQVKDAELTAAQQGGERAGEKGAFQSRVEGLLASLGQAQQMAETLLVNYRLASVDDDAAATSATVNTTKAVIEITIREPGEKEHVLFQAVPGQPLVIPANTVIGPSVFTQAGLEATSTALVSVPEATTAIVQATSAPDDVAANTTLMAELAASGVPGVRDLLEQATSLTDLLKALVLQQTAVGVVTVEAPAATKPMRRFPGSPLTLVHRPSRAASLSAPATPGPRLCPLCPEQWVPNERAYLWQGYRLKANRAQTQDFDIVAVSRTHQPQGDTPELVRSMIAFSIVAPGYRAFYNDPGVGASVPEHQHFQATASAQPIEEEPLEPWVRDGGLTIGSVPGWSARTVVVEAADPERAVERTQWSVDEINRLSSSASSEFQGLGILSVATGGQVRVQVYPRRSHRVALIPQDPAAYVRMDRAARDASGLFFVAPAVRETSGSFVTADDSTYDRFTADVGRRILDEASTPATAVAPLADMARQRWGRTPSAAVVRRYDRWAEALTGQRVPTSDPVWKFLNPDGAIVDVTVPAEVAVSATLYVQQGLVIPSAWPSQVIPLSDSVGAAQAVLQQARPGDVVLLNPQRVDASALAAWAALTKTQHLRMIRVSPEYVQGLDAQELAALIAGAPEGALWDVERVLKSSEDQTRHLYIYL